MRFVKIPGISSTVTDLDCIRTRIHGQKTIIK